MKTKLLMLLVFTSFFLANAQWNQVGSAQFTNFTDNVAMSFHPTNGRPYVVYNDALDSNKPKVMRYNGVSWVAVGGAISNMASANHAIKFNPATNEPWIAYRRTADNQMDVYSFDGTNWVARGTNLNLNFGDFKMQIAFNSSGDARVVGRSNNYTRIANFPGGVLSNTAIEHNNFSPQLYDFEDYNRIYETYYSSNYTFLRKNPVGNPSNWDFTHFDSQTPPYSLREVEGISGEDLAVARDVGTNPNIVVVNATNANLAQPNNSANCVGFLEFKKSSRDNKYYLMYADATYNLQFEKYNSTTNSWEVVSHPSISTSNTGFFVDMNMNPVTGNMFIAYMDSGKVSVQEFSIDPPLTKYYVNANVSGGDGSGDSWVNAMPNLYDALLSAGENTSEVWVASGTYKPGTSRSSYFSVSINGLHVYGGFNGTETSVSERDILANPTILSGDLNGDDAGHGTGTRGDNSYHVMQISNADNAVIDGFKIMYGHANGSSTNAYGGAINILGQTSNLIIKNCEFDENFGLNGGAIRSYLNNNTSMTFQNCVFNNNVSRYGAGLYFLVNQNRTVTLDVVNCLFTNNTSEDVNSSYLGYTGSSAWIRANDSGSNLTTTITNCTFANNSDVGTQSNSDRGTLGLSSRTDGNSTHNVIINNSIFYNNTGASGTTKAINSGHTSMPNQTFVNNSIDEDGFSNLSFLTNTSNADPLFTDASNNDFTLQSGSPAIDAGDNSLVPSGITADLLFNQRIHNATVDMGAYEFGASSTLSVDDFGLSTDLIRVYPNPTNGILNINTTSTIKTIEVYNVLGTKVKTTKLPSVNLSGLSNGFYLVKVNTETRSVTKRIIKR